ERGARSTPLRLLDLSALRTAGQRPQLVRLLLIYLVSTAGFAVLHAIMTYFVLDTLQVTVSRAPEQAARLTGYVFAWIGVLAIVVQGGAIRPLVKRFGEARLLLAGLGLLAAALAVLPAAHGLGMLLLVTTPLAVGNALCSANLPALLTFHSPAPQRGEILGVSQSLGSIGRIIGPLAGGALYDVGRAVPFWAGAVLCAVAVVLAAGLPANRPEETL
ncbi:MAG: MFS transporter, partial [Armatimonadetes bacterium]|nr:MFS transporter [Armatimonadota bacterium]